MVSSNHYIELYVNGQLIELESQDSLNLRINNVLFNPTKTTTTQAEYSYSFEIPSTENNNKVFDYANVLSKPNKFRARYKAQVYADGNLLFDGSLTIQKYSGKDKTYTCNLVNIKVNSLDDIFGDAVMTDVPWYVDFDGGSTINSVNNDHSKKYFFPLVAYGVFQKDYVSKDEVGATYTSKFVLDKYNKWWVESFYPSLNMMETIRKAFEWKGYEVNGTAFSDPFINYVYASCNLADEQAPIYNLGNPKFGHLALSVNWNNHYSVNSTVKRFGDNTTVLANDSGGLQQDLKFPYQKVVPAINASNANAQEEYNFSTIQFWNILDNKNNSAVTVTMQNESYMYDPTESLIVIPADGWYKIKLNVSASLSGVGTTFTADQWTTTFYDGEEFKQREIEVKRGLIEHTPLEIQLIRNYEDNIELIKGSRNIEYKTGNPNQTEYTYKGDGYTGGTYTNKEQWNSDYPHQELFSSKSPTNTEGLVISAQEDNRKGGWVNGTTNGGGTFGNRLSESRTARPPISVTPEEEESSNTNTIGEATPNTYGYIHKSGFVMPYDQVVSPAFICGFSSLGDGTVSVMRNGRSWSNMCSINNKIFADVKGMDFIGRDGTSGTVITPTDYCKNTYVQSSSNLSTSNSSMNGKVECCVYLNKNDILELVAVQRDYDGQKYSTSIQATIDITAMNNESYETLKSDPSWNIYSESTFPRQLNLFNFTNKETKVSEWINNVIKAFNLEIVTNGNEVEINTNKGIKKNITYAVDIDDRVSEGDCETQFISYPREMSVRYKINTDEWGFERTVSEAHINDEDWKEWGDSGYTVIQLNDDSYETSTQNTSTQFSYTYYDSFTWKEVLLNGEESGYESVIMIPVIEKSEYMADGYGYDEAMKHDGYSLTQRFWYRDQVSQDYVYLSSWTREKVYLTYPMNIWKRFNLSYKDSETSIVTEYFNIHPMLSSNYVKLETYLTPTEYKDIKNGAMVKFNSDLHYCSEISGYDPQGGNTTTLKLIKKP